MCQFAAALGYFGALLSMVSFGLVLFYCGDDHYRDERQREIDRRQDAVNDRQDAKDKEHDEHLRGKL